MSPTNIAFIDAMRSMNPMPAGLTISLVGSLAMNPTTILSIWIPRLDNTANDGLMGKAKYMIVVIIDIISVLLFGQS